MKKFRNIAIDFEGKELHLDSIDIPENTYLKIYNGRIIIVFY